MSSGNGNLKWWFCIGNQFPFVVSLFFSGGTHCKKSTQCLKYAINQRLLCQITWQVIDCIRYIQFGTANCDWVNRQIPKPNSSYKNKILQHYCILFLIFHSNSKSQKRVFLSYRLWTHLFFYRHIQKTNANINQSRANKQWARHYQSC